ncbi:MAG: long-chain-fatty-acid--CoA ligase [Campylobacterota bacterium]|nr:long-chain-fatty-acid--CoA ligase [Campylobacterota bacterium]
MKLDYKYNNFYEIIEQNSKQNGKKTILYSENGNLTNNQLKDKIDTFADFLIHSGIKKDDKVAMVMENSEYFIISLFAITKIGAVAVPINNFLKNEELEYILNNSNVKILITSDNFKEQFKGIEKTTQIEKTVWVRSDITPDNINFCFDDILTNHIFKTTNIQYPSLDDIAVIVYTSGTTGHPKGAMLSHKNILSNCISGSIRFDIVPKDRFIVYLPMFHSFTLSIMIMLPLYNNCSVVIVKSIFPFANVLKQVLLKRVTIFLGAPQIYNALNKAKIPWYFMWFNCIRGFVSGSAPLSEQVLIDFKNKFKKATVMEGYGLSECSPAVAINPFEKQKSLSVGIPLPSYEVKIVDEELLELKTNEVGELIVKGDCVMQGYYNNEEATNSTIVNGWLKTGDLGKKDEDGYIYVVDRKKDLIISKGVNIYPREIEELIYKLDDVDASAVVGIEDETKDEKIVAFIQLKEDLKTDINEKDVKKYLKEHLANFKVPKHIYFIDELPKNATNKVLKRKLKEDIDLYINK